MTSEAKVRLRKRAKKEKNCSFILPVKCVPENEREEQSGEE